MTTTPSSPVPPAEDKGRILERPDGFYWQDNQTLEEFGPFPTLTDATRDMQQSGNGFGATDCD